VIVHGVWFAESLRFYLWAEQPSGARARGPKAARRAHPFAVPADALAAAMGLEGRASSRKVVLRLPTCAGQPQPSPELARRTGADAASSPAELAEWEVPALELGPADALSCLASPAPEGRKTWADGPDLASWRAAARFALGLLRRERWLPAMERDEEGRFAARWVPALNLSEDAARFRALAEAMPPACRALVGEKTTVLPGRQAFLRSFLAATVDSAVRAWNAEAPSLAGGKESVAASWLAGLRSTDGRLAERMENLRPLAAALRTWAQPVLAASDAGFRACFRLDPPPDEAAGQVEPQDEQWALTFWLQAIDEPSLLVPAEEIWERGRQGALALGRRGEAPQETLLPALARAARVFPPIQEALKSKAPSGCGLSTPEAYQFLREAAPLLEETGNGVLTPDWWRKPSQRLGLRVQMRPASRSAAQGILTQERLVEFDWQVALGEEPLSAEEFAQLASLKEPLVRLRGRWLEVHPGEVERAIRAWERRRKAGPLRLLDALRLPDEEEGLPVVAVDAEGELQGLLRRLQGDQPPEPVPVPESFHGTLRPYQQYGLEWLAFLREWGLGACLADDMGLGKTVQVLAYLLHARPGQERPPALLVCPTSLVENWRREAARFAPELRVYVHHGAARVRATAGSEDEEGDAETFAGAVAGHDLVVTTYPLALRDEEALRTVPWDAVILDEAQNIKNPGARQTQAVRSLRASARIAMTGTPVENRLTDLWSVMEFLNPGFLGSERGFRGKYAVPIERHHDPEASERLRRLTRPFILRRVKTDPTVIQDLPEKQEMKVVCPLTAEQATLYEAVVSEMLEQVEEAEGIQRRGLVLSVLSRLKQICNHPAHFLHDGSALPGRSGKLERLAEMLEEVFSVGEAALVFTQFAEMGALLRDHLRAALGREALFLHGGVPRKQRDGLVERFQAPEGPPVMVLSLKAGGVGLNLTRASHVFHFDRWWNPAVENQATDRAFRIGQTRAVQVHKFLCAGTLEDHIDTMIEQKQELAQSIVGAGEDWLTELSTAQLRELISLRRDSG
jgi:SNF2 family DNA or RNA helicase